MNITRDMTNPLVLAALLAGTVAFAAQPNESSHDDLAKAFLAPPTESKPSCYWWWLNGAASKEGITRDFEKLADWTTRPEDGIRHYSGTATYRTTFELPSLTTRRSPLYLDLGAVKNVARVRLNGRDLGVVWTAPWRIEITGALKSGANALEVEVANLWPNRLIGDATLPKEKRFTVTNVRTYDTMTSGTYGCSKCEERKRTGRPAELSTSGLLGPVRILAEI